MYAAALFSILALVATASSASAVNIKYTYLTPRGDSLLPVDEPSAVYFPHDDKILVFGGQTNDFATAKNTARNNLFEYSIPANEVRELKPTGPLPGQRAFHSAWRRGRDMFILGGINYTYTFSSIKTYSDLWKYDSIYNSWTQVPITGATFPPLASSVAIRSPSGLVYIFGGVDNTFTARGELWTLTNNGFLTLLTVTGPKPEPRYHAYRAELEDGFMVMGGVRSDNSYINDIWFYHYDTNTWTQRNLPNQQPNPRTHAVTGLLGSDFLLGLGDLVTGMPNCPGIVFGQAPVNDTWIYSTNLNKWEELTTTPQNPSPYSKYTADVVIGDNTIYSFGGFSFNTATCTQTYNTKVLKFVSSHK